MNRRKLITGTLAAAASTGFIRLGSASTPVATPEYDPWSFKVSDFELHELDSSTFVWNRELLVRVRGNDEENIDAHGVPMSVRDDGTLINHPVTQAQYLMRMLSNYFLTEEEQYLNLAKVLGYRLFDYKHIIDGAYYFPYLFDHRLSGNPSGMLNAPWYSGMAQGQVLQCFVRLWHQTQEDHWLSWAESTANSFLQINTGPHPGTMSNTESRDLWIEEYPDPSYFGTLNGHMFGYLGLYEYWLVTRESNFGRIIDGAMTTVLNTLESRFRNVGQPSHYSMNQESILDRYHIVHIAQLLETYRITQDQRFAELAILLHHDYPPYQVSGVLELAPGTYTIHPETRINPHLVIEESESLQVGTITELPVHWRRRIWDEERFYYRFTDDDGNAWHIEESDNIRLTGEYSGPHHDHGPLHGTRMEFEPPITIKINDDLNNVPVAAMALVDGVHHCMLADDDTWIPYEAYSALST